MNNQTTPAPGPTQAPPDDHKRDCPHCGIRTTQKTALFDPDEKTSPLIWVCTICSESSGWAD